MSQDIVTPPPVLWAQRKEDVLLTFSVESKEPIIKIEKDTVYFKAVSPNKKTYEVNIVLHDSVVPENSTYLNKGRCIEMVLRKESKDSPFWPNLTKDKKKPHWLKIDFNKWKDEDDDEKYSGGPGDGDSGPMMDVEEMLRSMGGAPGSKPAKPSFDDLEEDSDDENLPDLE